MSLDDFFLSVDQLRDVSSSTAHVWTAAAQTWRVELLWLFLGKLERLQPLTNHKDLLV